MLFSRFFDDALVYLLFVLLSHVPVKAEQYTLSPPQPLYVGLANCSFSVKNANYPHEVILVNSWGLQVDIASPPQRLCLEASTAVNNAVIMTTGICNNDHNSTFDQCVSRRGGLFNTNGTSDYNIISVNDLPPDPGWATFTEAGHTTLQFASDISLPSFPIALPENAANSSVSQLGLANNSVFLHQLVDAGLSPANGFSFLAGSQSVFNPRDGHLIIGGYDRASLSGPFTTYAMNSTTAAGSHACSLHVEVEALTLIRPNQPDVPLISGSTLMSSCIEPLDNLFRLPQNVLEQFQLATNWSNHTSVAEDLYVVEPGLYYDSDFNGTLKFSLQGGLDVEIPNKEMAWPVRGLDATGKKVLQDNITVVNILHKIAPKDMATLGKVFLSQLYLTVNYDLQEFQLAPANIENAGALDIVSFNNTSSLVCSRSPSDQRFLGVIVLACVLDIILIILCTYPGKADPESNKDKEIEPKKETAKGETIRVPRGRGCRELRTVAEVQYSFPIGVIRSYRVYKSWLKSNFWPEPSSKATRLRWICDCGVMLYEDYATTDPRVTEGLSALLNTPCSVTTECTTPENSTSIQSSSTQSISSRNGSSSNSSLSENASTGEREVCQGCSRLRCSVCAKNYPKKFLALCVNTGRFHNTLGEIDVTNICRDNETFRMIKARYLEIRGIRAQARRLFLFQPKSVHFVKLNVEDTFRADIVEKPSIPPKEEVLAKRYDYSPLDLPLPPITSNSFLHYIENPDCESLRRTSRWLSCLPKRLEEQLMSRRRYCEPDMIVTGWGIHIEEGLNEEALAFLTLVILVCSGLVGLIYSLRTGDVSGGFTIAGYIASMLGVGISIVFFRWRQG